jgi:ribosomal protein L4
VLKLAGSIDPDQLHAALEGGGRTTPSRQKIGKRARTDDAWRGMAAVVGLLDIFGKTLNKGHSEKHD